MTNPMQQDYDAEIETVLSEMVENTTMFLRNDLPSLLAQEDTAKIRRVHKNEILKNIPEAKQQLKALLAEQMRLARQQAKQENARDFSAVVKAFNEALEASFDAPTARVLRMVLNGADARANYVDLPEQSKPHKHEYVVDLGDPCFCGSDNCAACRCGDENHD